MAWHGEGTTLVGAGHEERYIDLTVQYLGRRFPHGIGSLMIEQPPAMRGHRDGFFTDIAERYEGRGTRIIYGDRARVMPPPFFIGAYIDCAFAPAVLLDAFTNHSRDEAMIDVIRKERRRSRFWAACTHPISRGAFLPRRSLLC